MTFIKFNTILTISLENNEQIDSKKKQKVKYKHGLFNTITLGNTMFSKQKASSRGTV